MTIGALCLLDTVPRTFDDAQLRQLVLAATVVNDQLELLRRLEPTAAATLAEARALTEAVDDGQILPHYQPIVQLRDSGIVGVEALARWQHPVHGLLPPGAFIPLAEDTDIIIDLDLAILRQAATDLARWTRRHPELRLSVNLSARHFDHPDCIQRLTDTVLAAHSDPAWISFEVTETIALANHLDDRNFLLELRQAGFQVLLDDFGTGFSSLDQLLHLPIDGIKLDRTLTAALHTHAGQAITRALLTLADELHLHTVIEGIETPEQATAAQALCGRIGQGYLWAAALPAAAVEAHFRTRGRQAFDSDE